MTLINPAAVALRTYLSESRARDGKHLSHRAFGERVGITDGYVSMLKHGKNNPHRRLALKIEKATNGAVPADLWESPTVVLEPQS